MDGGVHDGQQQADPPGRRVDFDNSYARLPEAFHAQVNPVPVPAPKLVVFNAALAQFLGLNPDALKGDEGGAVFSGNRVPEGAEPISRPMPAISSALSPCWATGGPYSLGEQLTPRGERFDIQYKGSGRTPFSRQGDGRAALGPRWAAARRSRSRLPTSPCCAAASRPYRPP